VLLNACVIIRRIPIIYITHEKYKNVKTEVIPLCLWIIFLLMDKPRSKDVN